MNEALIEHAENDVDDDRGHPDHSGVPDSDDWKAWALPWNDVASEAGFPGDETSENPDGAGTGATALRPAPPSSVDPRGMPARPTDDRNVTGPETSRPLVGAQETDASPGMPPPSYGAPDCDKLVEPEQPVLPTVEPAPDSAAAGPTPGVAPMRWRPAGACKS